MQARSRFHRFPQRRVDRVEQRTQTERDVLNSAVDEECGRMPNTALSPILHMFSNSLQIPMIVHFGSEPRDVELQLFRVALQLRKLQVRLVVEQQVVHRPKLALSARAFPRLRRLQRQRMNLLQRKMAIDEAYATREMPKQ